MIAQWPRNHKAAASSHRSWQHNGLEVITVASQQDCPGFEPRFGIAKSFVKVSHSFVHKGTLGC